MLISILSRFTFEYIYLSILPCPPLISFLLFTLPPSLLLSHCHFPPYCYYFYQHIYIFFYFLFYLFLITADSLRFSFFCFRSFLFLYKFLYLTYPQTSISFVYHNENIILVLLYPLCCYCIFCTWINLSLVSSTYSLIQTCSFLSFFRSISGFS